MAFKMKNPISGIATPKSHGKNKNFGKSGMKNADGSNVKPGAPGFFGNLLKGKGVVGGLLNPMGAIMSRMKKKKAAAAQAATPVDPNAAAQGATAGAGAVGAVPADEQAGAVAPAGAPIDPNAQVDPNAAPMQMKGSPAKDKQPHDPTKMTQHGGDEIGHNVAKHPAKQRLPKEKFKRVAKKLKKK